MQSCSHFLSCVLLGCGMKTAYTSVDSGEEKKKALWRQIKQGSVHSFASCTPGQVWRVLSAHGSLEWGENIALDVSGMVTVWGTAFLPVVLRATWPPPTHYVLLPSFHGGSPMGTTSADYLASGSGAFDEGKPRHWKGKELGLRYSSEPLFLPCRVTKEGLHSGPGVPALLKSPCLLWVTILSPLSIRVVSSFGTNIVLLASLFLPTPLSMF